MEDLNFEMFILGVKNLNFDVNFKFDFNVYFNLDYLCLGGRLGL